MYSKQIDSSSKAIPEEQMNRIIDCILEGKYSSACLTLLEATGYNPLQYIPYRTYNRLQKQRLQANRAKTNTAAVKVVDLEYVDAIKDRVSLTQKGGIKPNETVTIRDHFFIRTKPFNALKFQDLRSSRLLDIDSTLAR